VRVLVVSDLRLYRHGAASALRGLPEVSHVTTADTAATAVVTARRTRPDVLLMDMSMSEALPATRSLLSSAPTTRVVALGIDESGPDVVTCAELGITGYLSRNATLEEVRSALRASVRGEAWCSGRVAVELIRHISRTQPSRPDRPGLRLTRRERDVLTLLESGMANKEIARALEIQLSTVKNHVHNLLGKLGASGRAELVGPGVLRSPLTLAARPRTTVAGSSVGVG